MPDCDGLIEMKEEAKKKQTKNKRRTAHDSNGVGG